MLDNGTDSRPQDTDGGPARSRGEPSRGRFGYLIVLALIAVAACLLILMSLRNSPRQAAAEVPVSEVAERATDTQTFRGHGTVVPKVRVEVASEVPGRVVFIHSQLRAGGLLRANEPIVQIDPSGYELAVRHARAVVDEARARLDLELLATGLHQWEGPPASWEREADLPVLHEPRVRRARAVLESAKAQLALAELQLGRTVVTLPVDVWIARETVSLGQYVGAGRPLALAYGTEAFRVEIPIRDEELAWLGTLGGSIMPGFDSSGSAPISAQVQAVLAGGEHTWQGVVVGTTGQVDPASGKMTLVVEVPQPLATSGGRLPLLPGLSVEVIVVDNRETDAQLNVGRAGE
jgi:multidrug efflux pump subunit AcrA (membrane-fusion protein)